MLDIETMKKELDFKCKMRNLTIIQDETLNTSENRELVLAQAIDNAVNYAYNRRKGTSHNYNFDSFYVEAEKWHTTIINMAFTSLQKSDVEGHTSLEDNGTKRIFESGGLYLLSDVAQITQLVG